MAVLCMKNEWIPILPDHDATRTDGEHVLLSSTAVPGDDGNEPTTADSGAEVDAYVPDRFGTPEDTYDDDTGPTEAADPNSKNADDDVPDDIDFDIPASGISLQELADMTSRLQARHAKVQSALKDATAATREATANVFEMMARLEKEKARIKEIMGTVCEIVGESDDQDESSDEEVDEDGELDIVSEKRKGKERTTGPIRSAHSFRRESKAAGFRASPLCPNCRVARDLTVSQHHSIYLCAEHMPNPYKTKGASNDDSSVPTSATGPSSRSARNNKRSLPDPSSSRDSTIIFGLTTKPVATSTSSKRSLEESEADPHSSASSPKRARVEASQNSQNDTNSQQISSSNSTPVPKTQTKSVCEPEIETVKASEPKSGTSLRRSFTVCDLSDADEMAGIARMENPTPDTISQQNSSSNPTPVPKTKSVCEPEVETVKASEPKSGTSLRRSFTVCDLSDADEMACIARMENPIPDTNSQQNSSSNPTPIPKVQTKSVREVERVKASEPKTGSALRRSFTVCDLSDPDEMAGIARMENPSPDTNSQQNSSSNSTPVPKTQTKSVCERVVESAEASKPRGGTALRRSFTVCDLSDPDEMAGVARMENPSPDTQNSTPQQNPSSNPTPVPKAKSVREVERVKASEPKSGSSLRRSFTVTDLSDRDEMAAMARKENSILSLPRTTASSGDLNVITNAERPPTPRRNAPLLRTASVVDMNNAEEMANAAREERYEMNPTRRRQSPGVNNPAILVKQQPPPSRKNAPLRRTISIHDINDPVEVAYAEEREKNPSPRWTTAKEKPQGRVSRRVRERLTASAESTSSGSSSNIIRGKRQRDSDGNEEERVQKKTRIAEASN